MQTARVTFPKDDVDRIIEDFAHITSAIGIDAISDKP